MQIFSLVLLNSLTLAATSGTRVSVLLHALRTLHVGPLSAGMLMALFSLVAMPLAVPLGRWIDRIGTRPPLVGGALALCAGLAMFWQCPTVAAQYAAATLAGTGWLTINLATVHAVGTLSAPERRAANLNWLTMGYSLAIFVGPVTTGFMLDHFGHDNTSLVIFAAGAVVALLTLSPGVALPPHPGQEGGHHRGGVMGLMQAPGLGSIYFVGTLIAASWELYTFIVPLHGTRLGFSASTIGVILGCFSAATFVVRAFMPRLSRAYGEWEIVRAALFTVALCFIALPFVARPELYMALSVLIGLALGSCLPNMLALLHAGAPPGRTGEAVGIRVTITNTSQVFVPLLVGGASAAVGMLPVLWSIAALLGAGLRAAHRQCREGA